MGSAGINPYLMVFFVIPVMVIIFFFSQMPDDPDDEVNIQYEKNKAMVEKNDKIARTSIDCKELKQTQLELLGYGVNPDSWFPRGSDKAMKVAQDRYDLLC